MIFDLSITVDMWELTTAVLYKIIYRINSFSIGSMEQFLLFQELQITLRPVDNGVPPFFIFMQQQKSFYMPWPTWSSTVHWGKLDEGILKL